MEKHLLSSGSILGQSLKTSVKSTSSEQLINFISNPFETGRISVTDETFSNNSVVLNTKKSTHPSPISSYSNSHLTANTNSSSCENFRNHNDLLAPTLPATRLAKASSDNPILGCLDDNLVPPIPPRDYFSSKKHKSTNIHPILRDGQKLSSTHYWLLPDKQNPVEKVDDSRRKSDYINFKEIEKNTPSNNPSKVPFYSIMHPPRDLFGKLACGLHRDEDDISLLGEFSRDGVGCDNNVDMLSDTSSICTCNIDQDEDSKVMSMGEVGRTMETVMQRVDGVTLEECQTVLTMCGWEVDAAVAYLKVENLFRLGLASRERCKLVLKANNWDLGRAASNLVDITR